MADACENLIALTEVPDLLPRRRGRKIHYSTVFRWATKGARGKVLHSQLVGGIRFTTRGALDRFLSDGSAGGDECHHDVAAINRALDALGI